MKFFHVAHVYGFWSRQDRLAMGHGKMFHGWKKGPYDDRGPTIPAEPLEICPSGHWVPEVSYPYDLVVRENVKRKLEGVPGIAVRQVRWGKLVDLPYFPPGDFSYTKNKTYIRRAGKREERLDTLYHDLPDVPSLHEGFPTCYEVLIPTTDIGVGKYQLRKLTVPLPHSSHGPTDVELSADLLRAYPILRDMGVIFSETVWPLIDPHIDRDFFDVVEGEV